MKPLTLAFLILFTSIIIVCLPLSAEDDSEAVGTVTYIQGNCLIKSEYGDYTDAAQGQTVESMDTIKTLEHSEAEITLYDENLIKITEDTEVSIDALQLQENRYTNIGLLFGSIKLYVKRFVKDTEVLSVNTATVTAGVRGTEFDVSIREDGEVLINVEEGEIETEFDGIKHTIKKGNASVFSMVGPREDFKDNVDREAWRKAAMERLQKNPAQFTQKMLERERMIIARLKENQPRMEQYRKDFELFMKKIQDLERREMYRQERILIIRQIEKTRKVIGYFIMTRRQLNGIRSLIVLVARLEQKLPPETVAQLPSLQELKREYQKTTVVIQRISETDRRLRGALFMLNRKLIEVNRKIEEGGQ
jgi:hypothetical protein